MSSQSTLDQERFWEIIKYLVHLDRKKSFDDICGDLSLSKGQLNSFIHFMKEVGWNLNCESGGGQRQLAPPDRKPSVTLDFNLLEWLQFQACFPKLAENQGKPFYEDVKNKLREAEDEHAEHDLFSPAGKLEALFDSSAQLTPVSPNTTSGDMPLVNDMVSFLEEAILEEVCLKLSMSEGRQLSICPRKVVFLDGAMSLVGEGVFDKCLVNVAISEIVSATEDEAQSVRLFSAIEIEDFISSLRAVTENEVRLVLKVSSRERFSSNLRGQYFGKQCMFTNPHGDFIWAASIEPNDQIFAWLEDLGQAVEILDPLDFKKEFLNYCEGKLKKLA